MNPDFYIFGKNDSKLFSNLTDEKADLCHKFANNCQNNQMTVYRKDKLVYYVYTKRLSDFDDYFGVCFIFNGYYCTDSKKLFNLFEETIKEQLENKRKILKSELGKISFISNDFSRNKVEIDNFKTVFQSKINNDFQSDFQQIANNSFEWGDEIQQFVSLQDEPTDILNNIKKYQYVTITRNPKQQSNNRTNFENRIINFKQNHKWTKWGCALIFIVVLLLLIFLLVKEKCTLCDAFMLEIPLVASLYLGLFEKFTNGKNEIVLAIFSFIVSILGLALTIDNNVFSESNGDYGNIIKRCFIKENIKDISAKLNEWDSVPHLVIVLDMSGSINSIPYGNSTETKELFADVCRLMRTDTANIERVLHIFLHKKKFDKYTEYDVYKLKILKIIAEKQEIYQNKIDIVCFAGDVDCRKNVDCKKIISIVNNLESNKKFMGSHKTDFKKLFDELPQKYVVPTNKDHSNAPKYTFLFFSDYLHDIEQTFTNKQKKELTNEIKTLIYNFYSKQNFSNYFFTNTGIRTCSDKEIDIFPILNELTDENSKAHFVKIEDEEYDFMDILPKEVIPIYYEHSYPTSNLKTKITFDNIGKKETVKISFKKNSHNIVDCHHLFTVCEKDTEPVFPSNDVELSPDNPLTLTFSGRIIDNYTSTLLTFQSASRGYARFDIVFFKDLPWFCRYIISVTIFSFWLCVISGFIWFKK